MAQDTIYSVAGWLPYGVDDDSIIFRSSLTSSASFTSPDVGGADTALTEVAGGIFDSVKGYNPNTGYLYINDLTDWATCEDGYQISCEVQRSWLCPPVSDLTNGVLSDGDVLDNDGTGEQMFLASLTAAGYMKLLFRHISSGTVRVINPDATMTGVFAYSQGKDDYVTVNIGFHGGYGGKMFLAIDGCVIGTQVGNDSTLSLTLKEFYIGSQAGANRHVTDHYIRNLQISNRPPAFPVHPKLAKIGILSDSMFNSDDVKNSNHKDVQASWTIRRELAKKGLYCGNHIDTTVDGAIHVSINSGDPIHDTGVNTPLIDSVSTLLAENPQVVLLRGGTNDIINGYTIDASWDTELKALCDAILAGGTETNLIVGTVPSLIGETASHTATDIANTALINGYIHALPAYNSKISVADNFTDMGGESPAANTFKGQISGYTNEGADVHCAGLGHYLMGKSYANEILKILG